MPIASSFARFRRWWNVLLLLTIWAAAFAIFNISKYDDDWKYNAPNRVQSYQEARRWLYNHQYSNNNKSDELVKVGMGGGFASLLEMAALSFASVVANDKVAILSGDYKLYTANEVCDKLRIGQDGGTCFFRPATNRTPALTSHVHPSEVAATSAMLHFGNIADFPLPNGVPNTLTPSIWWGVILSYMFRLSPRMERRCAVISSEIGLIGPPDIGVHIRLGDKLKDIASRQSRFMNMTTAAIVSMYIQEIERAVPGMQKCSFWWRSMGGKCMPVVVYVASDSREAIALVTDWSKSELATPGVVVVARQTHTQNASNGGKQMHVELRKMTPNEMYILAEEIVYDMHILRQSRVVIGLVMSQIARASASMSFASGRLEYAIAIDFENTGVVSHDPQWLAPKGLPQRHAF